MEINFKPKIADVINHIVINNNHFIYFLHSRFTFNLVIYLKYF